MVMLALAVCVKGLYTPMFCGCFKFVLFLLVDILGSVNAHVEEDDKDVSDDPDVKVGI